MRTCPACGRSFTGETQFCPDDGTALVTPSRDPLVGRVIGERYRLDERLGRGAMGTVYRALHTRMEKPVAVKLLRAELAGDPEAVARFHREARSASRLDHEHCIRVTDFGQTDDGLLYLVMELLDGQSLTSLVDKGALPAGAVASIGSEVAEALAHAHEYGVIHRDLKPDNVVLARRGRGATVRTVVKVLDFGLAKIAGEAGSASVTRAGSVFGTPEYMSPEQAEGLPLDPRSDLYSLGVMLYHLATGELPFRSAHVIQLLAQHVEDRPDPPRKRRPDLRIPAPLEAVILRCLEKRPEARFSDAAQVAAALRPLSDASAVERLMEEVPTVRKGVAPVALRSAEAAGAAPTPSPAASQGPRPPSDPPQAPSLPSVSAAPGPPSSGGTPSYPASSSWPSDLGPPPRRDRRRTLALVAVALLAVVPTGALVIRAALPTAPRAAPDSLAEARRLLEADRLDEAERLLLAERTRADGARVQMLLGELARRRGQRLKALAHLHRATRLAPDTAEAHARLSVLLRDYGHADEACAEARLAIGISPDDALARTAAAGCTP